MNITGTTIYKVHFNQVSLNQPKRKKMAATAVVSDI